MRKLQFPLEYHTEVIRARAKEENTQQRVLGGFVVVLLATFFLQQAVFQRWNLATLAFLILPLAVVGGLVAVLVFDGGNFTLGAAAGLLTILGITMRNGVALVGHFQYLEQTEGHKFSLELVLRGCKERFVPIAVTLLATALAVAPFIVFGSGPGFEIVRSMAIFVLGGLVSSALIVLVVIPALYLRFGAGAIAPFIIESQPAAHAGLAGTR
jgi:Cu/Ag efflux pump CusA